MSRIILIDSGQLGLVTNPADFWAAARQLGLLTADKLALDADVVLAAQAATLDVTAWEMPNAQVIIATSNVGHLSRFVDAQEWPNIQAVPQEEQKG